MSQIQHVDELIREYLLYRGFSGTLKTFDSELKLDKEKGFRVDKIADQLLQYIYTYDLSGIRELWSHLDQKLFSKLENDFTSAIRKLESSLLKFYLVNAVANNKPDKVTEFFTRLAPDLQGQVEWKEWFMLQYIKSPEEHPVFSVHFTRNWQDTLMVSLHNFLAIIYQAIPVPVLANYEEESARARRLAEENDSLRQRLAALQHRSAPSADLMDDFYIIAQEMPSNIDVQGKSLKSLIRTIGGGLQTSPVMNRKPQEHNPKRLSSASTWSKHTGEGQGSGSSKRSVSLEARSRSRHSPREVSLDRTVKLTRQEFLLLSQEEVKEHKGSVTQCRFSDSGSALATSDSSGALKIWTPAPQLKLVWSQSQKAGIDCLDWCSKNERYLVTGSRAGTTTLYDTKDHKLLWEITAEDKAKVVSTACSPTESLCVSSCVTAQNQGKLYLHDFQSKRIDKRLELGPGLATLYATCCAFNHNGQLLVCGCSDGTVRTLDLRHSEVIDSWSGHQGAVSVLQLTTDQKYCFSLGQDNKLYRYSFNQTKQPVWEAVLSVNATSFTLDQSGNHVLLCGNQGATIYQINGGGVSSLLRLTSAPAVVCDWVNANQCGTCVLGSPDGSVCTFTLLTP